MKLLPKWNMYFENGVPKGIHTTDPGEIVSIVQMSCNKILKCEERLVEEMEDRVSKLHTMREIVVGRFGKEPSRKDISDAIAKADEDYCFDNILELKSVYRERTDEELTELFESGEENVTDAEYKVSVVSLMAPDLYEPEEVELDFDVYSGEYDEMENVEIPDISDYEEDENYPEPEEDNFTVEEF